MFSWWLTWPTSLRQYHAWACVPGCYKKAGMLPWQQGSRQCSPMASASAPFSRFLLRLNSCPDFLWYWAVMQKEKCTEVSVSSWNCFWLWCFTPATPCLRQEELFIIAKMWNQLRYITKWMDKEPPPQTIDTCMYRHYLYTHVCTHTLTIHTCTNYIYRHAANSPTTHTH